MIQIDYKKENNTYFQNKGASTSSLYLSRSFKA